MLTDATTSCKLNASARSDDKSYLLSLCLNAIEFHENALVLGLSHMGPETTPAFSALDYTSQVV